MKTGIEALTLNLECRGGGIFSFSCPSLDEEAFEGLGFGEPVRTGGDFCRRGGVEDLVMMLD